MLFSIYIGRQTLCSSSAWALFICMLARALREFEPTNLIVKRPALPFDFQSSQSLGRAQANWLADSDG